jgi:glycosyltransferase involved in cell wall biosynthesis
VPSCSASLTLSSRTPQGLGASTATPWLSLVIPSYRGEKWIETALDSVAAQSPEGIEVLLVDGGPTSAAVDIARTYCSRLRLRIFERNDLDSWHTKTNFAVQMAEAEHICWLGVDDVWLPERAAAVRGWIEESPQVPLHLSSCVLIDRDGNVLGCWRCPLPYGRELSSPLVCQRLLVQNFIAAPTAVFRRDAWLRCGGLDEQLWYTADWDIWLKLAGTGPVIYHNAATVGFRIHGASLTVTGSRDSADFKRQMEIVLERHLVRAVDDVRSIERSARTSIEVNVAAAAAAAGDWRGLPHAAWEVCKLGPLGVGRYLRDSRIWERTLPRVRAKLSGSF